MEKVLNPPSPKEGDKTRGREIIFPFKLKREYIYALFFNFI